MSPDENSLLRDIERLLKKSVPVLPAPEFKIVAPAPRSNEAQRVADEQRGGDRAPRGQQGGRRHDGGRGRAVSAMPVVSVMVLPGRTALTVAVGTGTAAVSSAGASGTAKAMASAVASAAGRAIPGAARVVRSEWREVAVR